MSSDFTPLVQALKAKQSASGTSFLTRDATQRPGDTAFFTPVAPSQRTGDTAILSAAAAQPTHQPVQVETKRDGDRITQIKITCRCGELIQIDCEY